MGNIFKIENNSDLFVTTNFSVGAKRRVTQMKLVRGKAQVERTAIQGQVEGYG